MPSIITHPDEITPAWLTGVLQTSGVLAQGHSLHIHTQIRQSLPEGLTVYLQPEYAPDTPVSAPHRLFLKVTRREARFGIPGIDRREVMFYQMAARSNVK